MPPVAGAIKIKGPAGGQPPAPTSRGQATREALIASALHLIATTGTAATTTQAVLDASGLSRGSLLHQFPTRQELLIATAAAAMQTMLDAIAGGLHSIADPIAALHQYPRILWQVQNSPAARALSEIQLAARWDDSLAQGLARETADIDERITQSLRIAADANGIADIDGYLVEIFVLINATQNLAAAQRFIADKAKLAAALDLLTARHTAALQARLPRGGSGVRSD